MSLVTKQVVVVVLKPDVKVFGSFETRNKAVVWITQYINRPDIKRLDIGRDDCCICETIIPMFNTGTPKTYNNT